HMDMLEGNLDRLWDELYRIETSMEDVEGVCGDAAFIGKKEEMWPFFGQRNYLSVIIFFSVLYGIAWAALRVVVLTWEFHYKLEDENVSLEFMVLNYAKENAHLKTTYKNLFDSINDSKQRDTTKGTSVNTKLEKQSLLGKTPSFSGIKLYSVTPLPKSKVIPKVVEMIALSKPVTSNLTPSTKESKVMKNDKVIALGMFRINTFKTSRVEIFVPNKPVKASVRTKPITTSQPHVITKKDNDKIEVVYAMCKQCLITANHDVCVLNYVNDMNAYADNHSANVSNVANLKKHKPKVKKPKKSGSKESLATPKPKKPRTCLKWSPTERTFNLKGKLIESSES
nr:hypothetical protein [Tanacetum cinerariifolium]